MRHQLAHVCAWVSLAESADTAGLAAEQICCVPQSGRPLLYVTPGEVVVAIDLQATDRSQSGARIRQWPGFNYLLYVAACQAGKQTPEPLAAWKQSPLLGLHSPSLWLLFSGCLWLLCGLLFVLEGVRDRSLQRGLQAG